jgi:hypothetical protein
MFACTDFVLAIILKKLYCEDAHLVCSDRFDIHDRGSCWRCKRWRRDQRCCRGWTGAFLWWPDLDVAG